MLQHRLNTTPEYIANIIRTGVVVICLLFSFLTQAQEQQDTAQVSYPSDTHTVKGGNLRAVLKDSANRHSPKKAMIMSLILPGLGQAYNHKYWKIPIIYAGFAGAGVAIYYTAHYHRIYTNAYKTLANDSNLPSLVIGGQAYDADEALDYKNYYKRLLDISCIFTAVLYTLNVIDAIVDAHLFTFDVSDKLTMKWQPVYEYQAQGGGSFVGLKFNFRL